MTQTVIVDFPPCYDEIVAAFPSVARSKTVIFSYGARIYSPYRSRIEPELLVHESVHGERQRRDPADWWRAYLDDVQFRLAEEIPAHQAEYAWLMAHGNRGQRRSALRALAERMASPMYGRMIGRSAAEAMLKAGGKG